MRKLVGDLRLDYGAPAPFDPGKTLGEAFLSPTRIYVRAVLAAHRQGLVKGLAHITGGGFPENVPRVLPDAVAAELDAGTWALPPVFAWLAREGKVAPEEMARTFNCGIGMIVVVAANQEKAAAEMLRQHGETVFTIGNIVRRSGEGTVMRNLDSWRG